MRALVALLAAAVAAVAPSAAQERRSDPLPLTGLVQEAPDAAAGFAFVELERVRDTYLVHEPFTLRLLIGFERDFLASGLVPLFQRELELPVQVHAPWLAELDGARALSAPAIAPADGPRLALGEDVVRARRAPDETRGDATYAVFALERTYVADAPRTLELEAPSVRFAAATRFEDDFVNGRIALDRRELVAGGRATRLVVAPLPETGRPPDFSGAIGHFTIRAAAEPRELAAGDGLALEVVVEGEGELSRAAAPRLEGVAGFHVRGMLAEHEPGRLVVRYDLVPRDAGVRSVPPIAFAYFDTAPPAGYRTIETDPIALVVRPAAGTRAQEPPATGDAEPSLAPALWLGALALAVVLAVVVLVARRRAT